MTDAQTKPREWTITWVKQLPQPRGMDGEVGSIHVSGPAVFAPTVVIEATPAARHAGEMRKVLENFVNSPPERPNYAEAEDILTRIAAEEASHATR